MTDYQKKLVKRYSLIKAYKESIQRINNALLKIPMNNTEIICKLRADREALEIKIDILNGPGWEEFI